MAAVLGTRLYSFISTSINIGTNVCFWSDSQIVLSWITSKKPLKPFVSNRIKEIRSVSTEWKYCPSADTPADLLTRGITFDQLNLSIQWKHGPTWLTSPSRWPIWPNAETLLIQTDTDEEVDVLPVDTTEAPKAGLHHLIDVTHFSELNKLLAVTAFVCRFINNAKHSSSSQKTGPLTASELTQANLKWIHDTQNTVFAKEITNIPSGRNRLPLVRQLRLFLDNNNLLRCGGRIHNAPLSELAKFPYLLPTHHHFTTLVIQNAHIKHLHSGVNATLTTLRQTYWIPSARQRIKSIIRKCVVCKKSSGKPYAIPDPPPLVKSRVTYTNPFNITGVDFTGALYVRTTEGERKVYLCLFTCAVCRAVHLEIVNDLSVECFLQAFRRFAGRRSLPRLLLSDNGSTFLAAAEELKALLTSTELSDALAHKGVEWKFIPKNWSGSSYPWGLLEVRSQKPPWFGGFWERLIGLTKSTLKKTLGRTHATLESLQTITVEVEAILNDRPLTYVSPDISDLSPITPSHLLHGRRIVKLPHTTVQEDEICDPNYMNGPEVRHRAKRQAIIIQHFENRWKSEYLTVLRETHRVTGNNHQEVKAGDIVLVHDDAARINWRMAVIESVNKGADGMIRSANIRTTTGRNNRPIARLYPLEITVETSTNTPADDQPGQSTIDTPVCQPTREAAKKGQQLCVIKSCSEHVERRTSSFQLALALSFDAVTRIPFPTGTTIPVRCGIWGKFPRPPRGRASDTCD
ncbi:uncharacterized protein [Dysidea avara]|uniref:uncharacterized protein n=1 Tax=Dysidea avara TaxID=196820 RepID=UPI0033325AC4